MAGWTAAQRDIRQIERATEAASALTRQLLAFARREVVRPRSLDLNAVVAEVEALLSRTIGEDVELVVHPSPGLPAIEADPGQLQQLLMNLAINARHAMPRGGLLSITTAPTGGGVQLIVTDTGHGMDPETLNRAFEPFFTTKPRGEGSGLGLATVYGIVTQAGGDVLLESTVGIGTTLTATVPVAVDQTVPSAHSDARHTSGGPETVLVLDDEDGIRDVAERILRRHGYHVIVASTGEEAVEQAEHHAGPIDVLLTDVVMPRTSGPAVAEAVRVRRPGVRVLFMSGYARPELASHGRLGEGVELLEKPFTEAALLAKLRLVLDDRSAHR